MDSNSKVLLELEGNSNSSSASYLGSKLLFTRKGDTLLQSDAVTSALPGEKPSTFPVPKSQVLGRLKDFLGVISESNETLLKDAKENPDNYDIEVLSEKDSHYIEMDLMLGIADLHTPEAVAAAESTISGYQQTVPFAACSEWDSDNSTDDENDNDGKIMKNAGENNGKDCPNFASKPAKKDSSSKLTRNPRSRKRSKIVELC